MGLRKAPIPAPAGKKPSPPPAPPRKAGEDARELRLCTSCPVPHIENCGTCFGFGLSLEGQSPLSADRGCSEERFPFKSCPECGGIPKWFFGRQVTLVEEEGG